MAEQPLTSLVSSLRWFENETLLKSGKDQNGYFNPRLFGAHESEWLLSHRSRAAAGPTRNGDGDLYPDQRQIFV
jgi:hypothetical protein